MQIIARWLSAHVFDENSIEFLVYAVVIFTFFAILSYFTERYEVSVSRRTRS